MQNQSGYVTFIEMDTYRIINRTLKIVPQIVYLVWNMQIVKYPLLCITESHTAQIVRQSVWKDWIGEASMDKTMMSFQIW